MIKKQITKIRNRDIYCLLIVIKIVKMRRLMV